MSESENFLSRWSRLKRESGLEYGGADEKRMGDALPGAAVPSPPAFDPASLPPIESIVADSDIRLFLEAGVPAELTRAALRSAWTADPAIRDFIGIADNQWDFNDAAAMPGFGSLGAADYALNVVARALGFPNNAIEGTPECPAIVAQSAVAEQPAIVEQPASARTDPQCSEPVDEPLQVIAAQAGRPHGGALPK
jgi:hypothetical protein